MRARPPPSVPVRVPQSDFKLRLILIYEVSVAIRSLIRRVDLLLQRTTGVDTSFSGKIMVCGGDFLQLLSILRGVPIVIAVAAVSLIRYADFLYDIHHSSS